MSTKQKVLYLAKPHGDFELAEADIPEPGPGEVLIEIHATALNPIDWKIQEYNVLITEYPAILGADAAGVIKKVGEGVTNVAVGDRVLHEGKFENRKATFQQYAVTEAEIVAKIPDNLTLDQAATIPVSLATAALGLYNYKERGGLGLTPPWVEGGRGKYANQPILVIGGSSSVGQHAIQFAKLSGFSPIITTASRRNEAFLKSIGATHVVDRSVPLPELPTAVKAITSAPVKVAYDAISEPDTQNAVFDILAPGGQAVIVLDYAVDKAKPLDGKEFAHVFGNVQVPTQREVGKSLYSKLTELLAAGDIKPNNVEVLPNGLAGIPAGLEKLKSGKVSAGKLVVRPVETA